MPNLHDLTAAESARAIRDGDISAVELVSALLERSRGLEPSPERLGNARRGRRARRRPIARPGAGLGRSARSRCTASPWA